MMPEAVSQTNGDSAPAAANGSTRGKAYHDELRQNLSSLLAKKHANDLALVDVEDRISNAEMEHQEKFPTSNIVIGYDNYMKAQTKASGVVGSSSTGTATRKKGGLREQDRIFSRSSVSWTTTALIDAIAANSGDARGTSSQGGTPAGLPTSQPRSSTASARETPNRDTAREGKNKRKAGLSTTKDEGDDSEGQPKRKKITWGRD